MNRSGKKISAQNLTPGMVFKHTIYGDLEVILTRMEKGKVVISADKHGKFVYEPERMLEVIVY